ncbi:hypothetical protein BZM27_54315 [Paraburkholderia steynii]|uniref:Uncharacterized protein n=1 Tax=Paraburkholderia steynii TaxID=1245441 RepID=A0A4R0WZX0_9BURK|nr:hypothetical protein BZM27_54315 [Paraburkholderia steynii]
MGRHRASAERFRHPKIAAAMYGRLAQRDHPPTARERKLAQLKLTRLPAAEHRLTAAGSAAMTRILRLDGHW